MHTFCQKCRNDVEPGVDKKTLKDKQVTNETKAICPDCHETLPLSQYMIKSLASMGQFYSSPKAESAFAFTCTACKKCDQAKLSEDKQIALCSFCGEDLKISSFMIKAIQVAKNGSVDTN